MYTYRKRKQENLAFNISDKNSKESELTTLSEISLL